MSRNAGVQSCRDVGGWLQLGSTAVRDPLSRNGILIVTREELPEIACNKSKIYSMI